MIDKFVASIAEAVAGVKDGDTILVGGFGAVGQPDALVEGLIDTGARDLTVVANNVGSGFVGIAKLLQVGRVRKVICSFPRSAGSVVFEQVYAAGSLELELVPQGTLAERIRAAGAGIPAFYTPTGAGTLLAKGKEVREFGGRQYVLEHALRGDMALVEAWKADRWGNLVFHKSGRNFNPLMAMAARVTVVRTHHVAELGQLDPETIVTQGVCVDRIVHLPDPEDDILEARLARA